MTVFIDIQACPICGTTTTGHMATRSDGIRILQCTNCLMGYVEKYPLNINDYYTNAYYHQEGADPSRGADAGYVDYEMVASTALGWSIFLTPHIRSAGSILDVGCANGYFLRNLDSMLYDKYGIEVNADMIAKCQQEGITIIGSDIVEADVAKVYQQSFDIITGFAVLEHIPDITTALSHIKHMLKPSGIFLFELPLMSEHHPNDMWLRTSLEHIYYPTVESIKYLFHKLFGRSVIGREVYIKDYGCTFIGMIAQDDQVYRELEEIFTLFFLPPDPEQKTLPENIAIFMFLFDIIYAADIERADPRMFATIPPSRLSQNHIARALSLWYQNVTELKQATRWQEMQRQRWEEIAKQQSARIASLQEYISQQEQAKALLEQQIHSWQLATQKEQQLVAELTEWNQQLNEAKVYLEQQIQNWQHAVQQEQQLVKDLQAWNHELEKR
jgi:SAM-dependent methyltransferase